MQLPEPLRQAIETPEVISEWAVLDDQNRLVGGYQFHSFKEAEWYLGWLAERKIEMEKEAKENEQSGFDEGNEAWYRWNVGSLTGYKDGGEKNRTYRIVHRTITPWEDL